VADNECIARGAEETIDHGAARIGDERRQQNTGVKIQAQRWLSSSYIWSSNSTDVMPTSQCRREISHSVTALAALASI
jgi:hypothetical protein